MELSTYVSDLQKILGWKYTKRCFYLKKKQNKTNKNKQTNTVISVISHARILRPVFHVYQQEIRKIRSSVSRGNGTGITYHYKQVA